MFSLVILLFGLYLVWRFVWPLPWSKAARVALAAVLVLGSQWPRVQLWVFGTMFSPEFPRPVVILLGWLFCGFIVLLLLTVLMDIVGFVGWLVRGRTALSPVARGRVRYGVGFLAFALTSVGVWNALQVPEVRRVEVTLRDLPASLNGYQVVHLSDLHISRMFEEPWTREVVARVNALEADVVLISGDLIDGSSEARARDVAPLAALRARDGVFASPGNHEYYFDGPAWFAAFEKLGIRVLVNSSVSVSPDGLVVAGLADEAALRYGLPGPSLDRALEGVPSGAPVLLMAHRPMGGVEAGGSSRVGLQLSGHTHGGMIAGFAQLFVAPANGGFVAGLYEVGPTALYVSRGTGLWNGFPTRLGVPSEITLITMRSAGTGAGAGAAQ